MTDHAAREERCPGCDGTGKQEIGTDPSYNTGWASCDVCSGSGRASSPVDTREAGPREPLDVYAELEGTLQFLNFRFAIIDAYNRERRRLFEQVESRQKGTADPIMAAADAAVKAERERLAREIEGLRGDRRNRITAAREDALDAVLALLKGGEQ